MLAADAGSVSYSGHVYAVWVDAVQSSAGVWLAVVYLHLERWQGTGARSSRRWLRPAGAAILRACSGWTQLPGNAGPRPDDVLAVDRSAGRCYSPRACLSRALINRCSDLAERGG